MEREGKREKSGVTTSSLFTNIIKPLEEKYFHIDFTEEYLSLSLY